MWKAPPLTPSIWRRAASSVHPLWLQRIARHRAGSAPPAFRRPPPPACCARNVEGASPGAGLLKWRAVRRSGDSFPPSFDRWLPPPPSTPPASLPAAVGAAPASTAVAAAPGTSPAPRRLGLALSLWPTRPPLSGRRGRSPRPPGNRPARTVGERHLLEFLAVSRRPLGKCLLLTGRLGGIGAGHLLVPLRLLGRQVTRSSARFAISPTTWRRARRASGCVRGPLSGARCASARSCSACWGSCRVELAQRLAEFLQLPVHFRRQRAVVQSASASGSSVVDAGFLSGFLQVGNRPPCLLRRILPPAMASARLASSNDMVDSPRRSAASAPCVSGERSSVWRAVPSSRQRIEPLPHRFGGEALRRAHLGHRREPAGRDSRERPTRGLGGVVGGHCVVRHGRRPAACLALEVERERTISRGLRRPESTQAPRRSASTTPSA